VRDVKTTLVHYLACKLDACYRFQAVHKMIARIAIVFFVVRFMACDPPTVTAAPWPVHKQVIASEQ
jgi:hypothetical protein